MPDRPTHRSLSRAVCAGMRGKILAGRYAAGAKAGPAASLPGTAGLDRRWPGSFDVDQEPRDGPAGHRGLMDAVS
jgi:hypothetical protein